MNNQITDLTAGESFSEITGYIKGNPSDSLKRDKYGFLHFLVWEAHELRFLLELMFVLVSYQSVHILLYVNDLLPVPFFVHLSILSIIVLIVMFFDGQILCRANGVLKDAFISSYRGDLSSALSLTERSMKVAIPPSLGQYYLALSEFNMIDGQYEESEMNLGSALKYGASPFQCLISRTRSLFFSGKNPDTVEGLDQHLENAPLLQLEYGIISLVKGLSSKDAREAFMNVLKKESVIHHSGADSHDLSRLMLACIEMKTGKAETALDDLSIMLHVVTPELRMYPALRLYIAIAYLQRAAYYARKSAFKKRAKYDIQRALSICSYPLHRELAKGIKAS